MTARTPIASTVHEPFGKPGGPGLFHVKGLQLPAYVQHVAHELVKQGKSESQAIQMAIGIVKNWARGGGNVHPDVQAAAARAVAEWEAAKGRAHAHANDNGGIELSSTAQRVASSSDGARVQVARLKLAAANTTNKNLAKSLKQRASQIAAQDALSRATAAPKIRAEKQAAQALKKRLAAQATANRRQLAAEVRAGKQHAAADRRAARQKAAAARKQATAQRKAQRQAKTAARKQASAAKKAARTKVTAARKARSQAKKNAAAASKRGMLRQQAGLQAKVNANRKQLGKMNAKADQQAKSTGNNWANWDKAHGHSNQREAIELAGKVYRYKHGWIPLKGHEVDLPDGRTGTVVGNAQNADGTKYVRVKAKGDPLSQSHSEATIRRLNEAPPGASADQPIKKGDSLAFTHNGHTHVGVHSGVSGDRVKVTVPHHSEGWANPQTFSVPKSQVRRPEGKETAGGPRLAPSHGHHETTPKKSIVVPKTGRGVNMSNEVDLAVPAALRQKARKAAAKRGQALPDGSFPIRNRMELAKAKRAIGRANPGKRARVRAFINKRAKALGGKQLGGRGKA